MRPDAPTAELAGIIDELRIDAVNFAVPGLDGCADLATAESGSLRYVLSGHGCPSWTLIVKHRDDPNRP